ncbi:hypothetical protein ACIQ7D_27400 [Streptomyces sp. NPDC096310]|uniref:hypothetical protein n=1 Tax=Streptomyces sp. NPDC096310 TaxID=3366082 RepID=UPI003825C67D
MAGLIAAGVLLLAGCGGGGTGQDKDEGKDRSTEQGQGRDQGGNRAAPERPAASVAPSPRPATVEQLAAAVGCEAQIRMTVEDYRQGVCEKGGTAYTLISFTTDKGKREWVDYAQMYGGAYLIGTRWVIGTNEKRHVETARSKLGGSVEEGEGYASSGTGNGTGTGTSTGEDVYGP